MSIAKRLVGYFQPQPALSTEEFVAVGGIGAAHLDHDLAELFEGGICDTCGKARGERNGIPVRYRQSGNERSYNGFLVQGPDRLRGPTRHLFSADFLALLTDGERGSLDLRRAENVGKPYQELYELAGCARHFSLAELPSSPPRRDRPCPACGWRDSPHYDMDWAYPAWLLNLFPENTRDRPSMFIQAASELEGADSFTVGDWRHMGTLVLRRERWMQLRALKKAERKAIGGVGWWPVGVFAQTD